MTFVAPTVRSDGIEIRIVDKNGDIYGNLDGATIKKISWSLPHIALPTAELDVSKSDPSSLKVLMIKRDVQIIFHDVLDTATEQPLCWWGVFAGRKSKSSAPLSIICYDISAWFKVRPIEHASLVYTQQEQLDIAWNLITIAQTGTGYDLNITASFDPSGHERSRMYQRDQHKYIYDALVEFPKLLDGFDWDMQYDLAAGNRMWTPYYPKKGSVLAAPKFWYLKEGLGNIVDYDYTQNAFDSVATKVYATGGSANGVKFEQNYEDTAARDEFGQMVRVVSDGSQNDTDWLLATATKTVNQKKVLPLDLKIKVREIAATSQGGLAVKVLGVVHTGDTVLIGIDNDADQVEAAQRVGSLQWNADGVIDLDLIDPTAE